MPTPGVRPPLPEGYINGLACHPVDRKAFPPRLPGASLPTEDAHHISTPPIGSGMFKEEAAVPAPPSSSASTVPTPGVRPPLPPGYINGLACHPVDRKAFSPRLPGASLPEDAHSISTPPLGSGKANEASTVRAVPNESPSTVSTTDSDHLASNGSNDVEEESRPVRPARRATLRRLTTLRHAGRSLPLLSLTTATREEPLPRRRSIDTPAPDPQPSPTTAPQAAVSNRWTRHFAWAAEKGRTLGVELSEKGRNLGVELGEKGRNLGMELRRMNTKSRKGREAE